MKTDSTPLPKTVYSAESSLRNPLVLLKSLFVDLKASRELAWRLFVRNISSKYRQTCLGYLWALLPPLFTTLLWVFLNGQNLVKIENTAIPYPAFVLIGTLIWQIFIDALKNPISMVTANRTMLTRINLPREALILAGLGEVGFNFLIRLILLAGVFVWFDLPIMSTFWLFPLGIASTVALGTAIGLLLVPVGILYKDVMNALLMVTQIWFYLTPVVYPTPQNGIAATIAKFNPVTPILATTRDWLTTRQTGDLTGFCMVSGGSLVMMMFGWLLYRLAMPHLIERMSS